MPCDIRHRTRPPPTPDRLNLSCSRLGTTASCSAKKSPKGAENAVPASNRLGYREPNPQAARRGPGIHCLLCFACAAPPRGPLGGDPAPRSRQRRLPTLPASTLVMRRPPLLWCLVRKHLEVGSHRAPCPVRRVKPRALCGGSFAMRQSRERIGQRSCSLIRLVAHGRSPEMPRLASAVASDRRQPARLSDS